MNQTEQKERDRQYTNLPLRDTHESTATDQLLRHQVRDNLERVLGRLVASREPLPEPLFDHIRHISSIVETIYEAQGELLAEQRRIAAMADTPVPTRNNNDPPNIGGD